MIVDRVWNDHTAKLLRQGEMIEAARARRNRAFASQLNRRASNHRTLPQIGKTLSIARNPLQESCTSSEEACPDWRDCRPSVV